MQFVKQTIDFVEATGEGTGSMSVETEGFQGKGCDAIHDAHSALLGTRKSKTYKPEYYKPVTTKNKTGQKA